MVGGSKKLEIHSAVLQEGHGHGKKEVETGLPLDVIFEFGLPISRNYLNAAWQNLQASPLI